MSALLRITIINSIAPLWSFIMAPAIFEKYFYDAFDAPGIDVENFLKNDVSPAFLTFLVCVLITQIWWLWRAERNALDPRVRSKSRKDWWLASLFLFFMAVFLISKYVWIPYPQLPLYGVILLCLLQVMDYLVLFWMATAMGTPGDYRLVIPFAAIFDPVLGNKK